MTTMKSLRFRLGDLLDNLSYLRQDAAKHLGTAKDYLTAYSRQVTVMRESGNSRIGDSTITLHFSKNFPSVLPKVWNEVFGMNVQVHVYESAIRVFAGPTDHVDPRALAMKICRMFNWTMVQYTEEKR